MHLLKKEQKKSRLSLSHLRLYLLIIAQNFFVLAHSGLPEEPQSEYQGNWGLAAIHAQAAYDLGITGKGIRVGVVDDGTDLAHPEFLGKQHQALISTQIFDTQTLRSNGGHDPSPRGHGTHIAGIIAAAKNNIGMHGVAYNSQLVSSSTEYCDAENKIQKSSCSKTLIKEFIDNDANVRVVNNSWATDRFECWPTKNHELAKKADVIIKRGAIHVWAAGNESEDSPSIEQGLPFFHPQLKNYWLVVVSLDKNLNIKQSSNRCGFTAMWCLAAPGDDILAPLSGQATNVEPSAIITISDINYILKSGTSMAAPHVAGAVALVMERFPYMTTSQVHEVILTTATDLGEPGVDHVYGHGLLNIAQAMQGPGQLRKDFVAHLPAQTSDAWHNHIPGTGNLIKQGQGTLILHGDHSHTGAVHIQEGTLHINGQMQAPVLVYAQGTLRGTGTVSAQTIVNGTLAPGNSPGTIIFTAPLILSGSSQTQFDIEGTNLADYSKIEVNGNSASLAGRITINLLNNPNTNQLFIPSNGNTLQVLSASGGFYGGFDSLQQPDHLPQGSRFDFLFQSKTQASLIVAPTTLAGSQLNGNANAGANILNQLRDQAIALRPGPYNTWLSQALSTPNPNDIVYRLIGGQIYADTFAWGINYQDQIALYILDRMSLWNQQLQATHQNYHANQSQSIWVEALPYDQRHYFSSTDRLDTQAKTHSLLIGLDHSFSNQTRTGIAVAGTQGNVTQDYAKSEIKGWSTHMYWHHQLRLLSSSIHMPYILGQISYASLNHHIQRTLPTPWDQQFASTTRSRHWGTGVAIGSLFGINTWIINPELSVWQTNHWHVNIGENTTGNNDFSLNVNAQHAQQTQLVAQLRTYPNQDQADNRWIPQWTAAYQYTFNSLPISTAQLSGFNNQTISQFAAINRTQLLRASFSMQRQTRSSNTSFTATLLASPYLHSPRVFGTQVSARLVKKW